MYFLKCIVFLHFWTNFEKTNLSLIRIISSKEESYSDAETERSVHSGGPNPNFQNSVFFDFLTVYTCNLQIFQKK